MRVQGGVSGDGYWTGIERLGSITDSEQLNNSHALALDTTRSLAFVTNYDGGSLTVLDIANESAITVLAELPGLEKAQYIIYDENRTVCYVTYSTKFAVVDVSDANSPAILHTSDDIESETDINDWWGTENWVSQSLLQPNKRVQLRRTITLQSYCVSKLNFASPHEHAARARSTSMEMRATFNRHAWPMTQLIMYYTWCAPPLVSCMLTT